jgi:hypothetical protein
MSLQPWKSDMLSETLSDGLKNYRIGEKLHKLRLCKTIGLIELGRRTGLSPALLSKSGRYDLARLPPEEAAAIRKKLEAEGHLSGEFLCPSMGIVEQCQRLKCNPTTI